MNQAAPYHLVTPELLDEVLRRMLRAGSPHKILLFGSHARGNARPDSDLDLLNDGAVLNIAPLHELVPGREARKYWDELLDGKYEWSAIGKQLREKGIVPC